MSRSITALVLVLVLALAGAAHAATYVPTGYITPDETRQACDPLGTGWGGNPPTANASYDLPGQILRFAEKRNTDPVSYDWYWCLAQASDASGECPIDNQTKSTQNTLTIFAGNAYASLTELATKAVLTVPAYKACKLVDRIDGRPIPTEGCQAGNPANRVANPGRQSRFQFEFNMKIECPSAQPGGPAVEVTLLTKMGSDYDATKPAAQRYFNIAISYETTNAGVPIEPICMRNKAGCASCKTRKVCKTCKAGYKLVKGKCLKKCMGKKCKDNKGNCLPGFYCQKK